METLINLLFIQFIIVQLIDVSGFISEMENSLSKWLKIKAHIPKPFSCSYCLTFWVGLIYLLIAGISLPYVAFLLILCAMTTITAGLTYLIRDILTKIISIVNKLIL